MAISKSYSGAPKGFRAEFSTNKVRSEQLGFFKVNALQPGFLEARLRQISADKPEIADSCIAQVDSTEVSAEKLTLNQSRSRQIGTAEISSVENRLKKSGSPQNGMAQIRPLEVALTQVNIGQVRPAQNHPVHENFNPPDAALAQNNTAQIQPFELSFIPSSFFSRNRLHTNFTKVSFPCAIPADQVSKENLFQAHTISPTQVSIL